MTRKHLSFAMSVLFWTLGCAQAALAITMAQITGPNGLNFQWDVMALSFIICTVSGAAALLQRINQELARNPGHSLPRPFLFCASHMMGSWAAGLLAFILVQQTKWDVWGAFGAMVIASYAGARYLEAKVEEKYGKEPPAPPPPTAPQEAAP